VTVNGLTVLLEQKSVIASIANERKVAAEISPDDMLFDYLVHVVYPTDHMQAVNAYFAGGEDCARKFSSLCREHIKSEPKTILDFASGYGRVARYAKHVLPQTDWIACDIHPQAVEFVTERLGIRSILSTLQPEALAFTQRFDVVFALSFFSHTPNKVFGPWLRRLMSAVEPGGILIFTTHGAVSARNMSVEFDREGFYWNTGTDQLDLDSSNYGTSCVTMSYVHRALEKLHDAELIRYQQAFWWGHQDLYIVRRLF